MERCFWHKKRMVVASISQKRSAVFTSVGRQFVVNSSVRAKNQNLQICGKP